MMFLKRVKAPLIVVLTFILAAIPVFCKPLHSANAAEGAFARVLKDGALFYMSRDTSHDSAVFELTNTYYIYITNTNFEGDFYPAEYFPSADSGYSKLVGYVLKDDVTLWEEAPTSPYYPQIFAVAKSGAPLTNRPSAAEKLTDGSDNYQLTLMYTQSLLCYGKITNPTENKSYYFVIFGSHDSGMHIGYVPADRLNVTLPEPHPDPLPKEPEPTITDLPTTSTPPPSNKPQPVPGDDKYQILLIVAICIPALFVVYLMFKPTGKKRRYNYYDEYDDTR